MDERYRMVYFLYDFVLISKELLENIGKSIIFRENSEFF